MFKNKKILLVGLGILGGGVATAKFLLKHGAKLVITDKRDKNILKHSIADLPKSVKYILGKHNKEDFRKADIIVANPAVPRFGEWVQYAEKQGKKIFNDLTLFLASVDSKSKDIIAITGTRGKTTTTLWTHHFLKGSIVGGNIPEIGPLKIIDKKGNPFVLETSSFQLEYMTKNLPAPHIALITNLYQDHLNRHGTMKEYVRAKGGIFLNQTEKDYLILNLDNQYTKEFLKLKPKSRIFYISLGFLPKNKEGIFISKGKIYSQLKGKKEFITKSPFNADFLNQNLMGAMFASFLYKAQNIKHGTWSKKIWNEIIKKIKSLPQVPMRREVIINRRNLVVVNDSAGTSPDATVALLSSYRKVSKNQKILITGGTDKQLNFKDWAKEVSKNISKENLYLFEGSSTKKMMKELKKLSFFKKTQPNIFSNLKEIVKSVAIRKRKRTVLFSPSSASFEKFKNEFDRGRKFTSLSRRYF